MSLVRLSAARCVNPSHVAITERETWDRDDSTGDLLVVRVVGDHPAAVVDLPRAATVLGVDVDAAHNAILGALGCHVRDESDEHTRLVGRVMFGALGDLDR